MIETTNVTNQFDYLKQGYFDNIITGIPLANGRKLISFLSPYFNSVGTITEWKLIGIDPVTEIDLTSQKDKIEIDTNSYYFNGIDEVLENTECGIYYMKITDSKGQIFRTGVFSINLTGWPPEDQLLGDFDPGDFNDDFFKTVT